jgi:hypothetical protein
MTDPTSTPMTRSSSTAMTDPTSTPMAVPSSTPMAVPSSTPMAVPSSTPMAVQSLQSSGGKRPVWRDENTGEIVEVYEQLYPIYNAAIINDTYQYIKDGSSIFINPKTYYYYTGNDDRVKIKEDLINGLKIQNTASNPARANRIYQVYPFERFLMLTSYYIEGTLNPVTTQPMVPEPYYPQITIIEEALKENNDKLYVQRFNIIDTQDTLNTLTNKLNTLKLKLNTLKQKPLYSASGNITFY